MSDISYLRNKIIRPKHSSTLGMHIKYINKAFKDTYQVNVRYFSMGDGLNWGEKDTLWVTKEYLMSQFEALVNSDEIRAFEDAKWSPIENIVKYAEERRR